MMWKKAVDLSRLTRKGQTRSEWFHFGRAKWVHENAVENGVMGWT